jgi:hypothetical protein
MRILLTILLTFFLSPAYTQVVLDFSKHNFAEGKTTLHGQWEFYWDRLLSPDELKAGVLPGDLLRVPSSWSHGSKYSNLGKGTYRVRIRLPEGNSTDLSFYFPPVRCAAKVWVNGVLKDSIGVVGNPGN